jgi:hypothetical protein
VAPEAEDEETAQSGEDARRLRERSAMAGARAGRGFRYQDTVGAWLAALGIVQASGWAIAPEAGEDLTLFDATGSLDLQVRSRRGQRTPITAADIGHWLADVWSRHADTVHDEHVRVGIVVDRSVSGLDPTDLSGTLEEAPPEVTHALDGLVLPAGVDVKQLLARSHLLVIEDPALNGCTLLASHLGVPEAVADVVLRQLQSRLGALADERSLGIDALRLTAVDAGRIIEETLAVVDVSALDASVRDGLCEHVDFQTAVDDASFYLGVDTVPGHVVAGLVLDRPDDVADVVDRLEERGAALVTGPSGTGKTALAWLAAYATRQTIRWLRVRRDGDVAALLRYVDALRPTLHAPVGLVLDDIGSLGSSMWDDLAREARHRPGVLLLGTTREEDLDLVGFAPPGILVRPRLTETLAEGMWDVLRDRGQTTAGGWLEAYEESAGLMLEFLHLLTTGDRLLATIDEQVNRRRHERRDTELQVLRVTALAASQGAATDVVRLQALLAISDEDLQRALARLLEEHLVVQFSATAIGGLHRLRSEAICTATHRIPPPPLSITAADVIRTVHQPDLPAIVGALVGRGVIATDEAFAALTDRLKADPSPLSLAASLDGLRLAGLLRRASAWASILDEEGVAPAMRSVTVQLAQLTSSTLDGLDSRVAAAVPRLRAVAAADLRPDWLASAPTDLVHGIIDGAATADAALRLLHACAGLGDAAPPTLANLDRFADDTDLNKVAARIAAAHVDPDLGPTFAAAAGGADHLLDRVRRELPWVTLAELTTQDGAQHVRFSWLFLDSTGEDAHAAVVAVCRTFLDLFPEAQVVHGAAIDSSGEPAGFGDFTIAVKDIPRGNLVSPEQVHWNRQSLRSFAAMSALPTKTERLAAEVDLLRRTLDVTRGIGAAWVRGDTPAATLITELSDLSDACKQIPRAESLPDDPTEMSHHSLDVGDVADACRSLCDNALPRLFSGPNLALASFFHQIRAKLDGIIGKQYWRFLADDHDAELIDLDSMVSALHDVVCDRVVATSAPPTSARRRATRRPDARAIEAVAQIARRNADQSLHDREAAILRDLQTLGLTASVHRAPTAEPTGMLWPEADLLVVVDVESTLGFFAVADQVATAVRNRVEPLRSAVIAPSCHGCTLGDLALSVRQAPSGMLLPAFGTLDAWESIECPAFVSPLLRELGAITEAALVVGALADVETRRPLLEPEQDAAGQADALLVAAQDRLATAAEEDPTGFLVTALQPVLTVLTGPAPATIIARIARGAEVESAIALVVVRAAVLEWELDPSGAPSRFRALPTS